MSSAQRSRTASLAASFLAVLVAALLISGCGESSSTTSSAAKAAAPSLPTGAAAQAKAEAIFQREGLSYYIGVLKPSTVRFSHPCPEAMTGEEGHETPVAGTWHCAGWGLISMAGGEGKPGECQFAEGKVTANGLVGKPEGNAGSFSGSTCQLGIGLGAEGKAPPHALVASWEAKQAAESRAVKAKDASPEGQSQKAEEAKQEAEEAKRTEEAKQAEGSEKTE